MRVRFSLLLLAVLGLHAAAAAQPSGYEGWSRVRTPNFTFIGNAKEADLRRAALKLEAFREVLRQVMGTETAPTTPTNVVLFSDDASYRPHKPRRADGTIDDQISGYFQPDSEINYITLSHTGSERQVQGTMFHEYVHAVLDAQGGDADVPLWIGEGLADYYQTLEIIDESTIRVGSPVNGHLYTLNRQSLVPIDSILAHETEKLRESVGVARGLFYAQSWAMVHMLLQTGRQGSVVKYLNEIRQRTPENKAFEKAFGQTPLQMEADLRGYLARKTFLSQDARLSQKVIPELSAASARMSEAEVLTALGDLHYRSNRKSDAETTLRQALRLDPSSGSANTLLGSLLMDRKQYTEARRHLEKGASAGSGTYLSNYRLAYLLSREGEDEFGSVSRIEPAVAARIRSLLAKAIESQPAFVESYELLGYVSLVNNEQLDDAVKIVQKGLALAPSDLRLSMRLAEILARQRKFDEAKSRTEALIAAGASGDLKIRATSLLSHIASQREAERQNAERSKWLASGRPVKRIENVPKPSESEIERQQNEERIRAMNDAVRKPAADERRVLGRLERIDCTKRPLIFNVRTADGPLSLAARDFADLLLVSLDPSASNVEIGCDSRLAHLNALITYRSPIKGKSEGSELVAIEFVPKEFRVMTEQEMNASTLVVYDLPRPPSAAPPATGKDADTRRQEMLNASIRSALTKPAAKQKRLFTYLEAVDCSGGDVSIRLKGETPIRLRPKRGEQPKIVVFTPELLDLRFQCGLGPVDFPVVVTYTDSPDGKTLGEMVAIEFVPKNFTLDN